MKVVVSFLTLIFWALATHAQIVITEISYNPPESGNDSLEYIEIHNPGQAAINLEGYRFINGVDYTFPALQLDPGSFLVIAIDSAVMFRQLGVMSRQWASGALNNGGERIAIEDSMGNLVDEVEYDDEGDWPTTMDGTDGEGASIELCDPASDNFDGSSWRAADNDLGVIINGRAMKGTPGSLNTVRCLPPHNHYVAVQSNFFLPRDITINIGETILWENLGGAHNVNGTVAQFPTNPESFGNGAPSALNWTYTFTFNIAGFYRYQCDPHATFGMTGTVTVRNVDPFPPVMIGRITTNDPDGVPDSLGKAYTIEGVVHGPNFTSGGGIQLAILDDNRDGIEIFNANTSFGYQPALGDRIRVKGTVDQYFGLTQFDASNIELLSAGNALFDPQLVLDLNESTESELIKLEGLKLVDPGSWGMGTNSGFNVLATNGTDTFLIRVDAESELFSPVPDPGDQTFDLIGIGSQFDRDAPFDSGYQIWPRYLSDLMIITSSNDLRRKDFVIHPNPCSDILWVKSDLAIEGWELYSLSGEMLHRYSGGNHIDLANVVPGAYLIRIISEEGTITQPVIVTR